MKEDYVSFEIAKLLKEKGFPQNPNICNTAYTFSGKLSNNAKSFVHNATEFDKLGIKPITYSMAPTLQMAMKWLREVHSLHIMVNCIGKVNYDPIIQRFDGKDFEVEGTVFGTTRQISSKLVDVRRGFKTYENACESAIRYCLENLI